MRSPCVFGHTMSCAAMPDEKRCKRQRCAQQGNESFVLDERACALFLLRDNRRCHLHRRGLRTCDIHAGERLFALGHGARGWPGWGGGGTYWTELQVRFRWQACDICETGQSFQSLRLDFAGRRVKLIKLIKTWTQNLSARM